MPMTMFGSFRLWFLLAALAMIPLYAQEQKPTAPPHAIPEGTSFLVRLETKLDVSSVRPGKRFKAKLAQDLMGPDESVIPRGSAIHGHISEVNSGFHPRLLLSFDEIETRGGWAPLMATVIDVPGEHGLTMAEEGGIEQRGQGSSEHRGPNSDEKPSPVAAAAGVMRTIFSDHRLQLQKGAMLEVRLDRPLQIPWR